MISTKNYKPATALVTIAALAGVLSIGIVHNALAETDTKTITVRVNNSGINMPTNTDQKQQCDTVGANSGIADSCHATSTDNINQQGGILKK